MGAKLSLELSESELREIEQETGFTRSQVIRLCNRFAALSKDKKTLTRDDLVAIPEVGANPLGERIANAFFPASPPSQGPGSFSSEVTEAIDVRQFLKTLACFRPIKPGQVSDKKLDADIADGPPNSRDAKLHFAFRMYDLDNDGSISRDELLSILNMMVGSNVSPEQLASIADRTMVEADVDNDNEISFNEFKEIMTKVDIEQRMSIRFLS